MPTFTNAHIMLKAQGSIGSAGAPEKWSVGLRFAIVGDDVPYDPTALQVFVNAAHAAFITLNGSAGVLSSTVCIFERAVGARIGTNGKYDPLTQDTVYSTGATQAGSGSATLPWNTASVVSLRTNRPRGYASNGRVYWPALALAPTASTGRNTSTQMNNRLTAFRTCFNSLNTAAAVYSTNMRLAVMSGVGAGTTALVSSIRADDRLDSIERRENAAPSIWYTAPIP